VVADRPRQNLGKILYGEFIARFKSFTDQNLTDAFNCAVGKPGRVSARARSRRS
jgi:hypothetical protein